MKDLIPPKEFYTRYIAREMDGTNKSDIEVLEVAVKEGWNVLLQGPTGPGKTSAYLALCAKNEWPLGIVNLNGMTTVEDLVGQVVPTSGINAEVGALVEALVQTKVDVVKAKNSGVSGKELFEKAIAEQYRLELELDMAYRQGATGLEWHDGLLVRLMKGHPDFKHTVFLADEVNFGPAKVMALMNGTTDDRRSITLSQHTGEVIKAHSGFHFAAAMNPNYEGTRPLNKAFQDRFHMKLTYDYDEAIERKLVSNPKIVDMARKLRLMYDADEIQTPISTRALMQFEQVEAALGRVMAVNCFVAGFHDDERTAVKAAVEMVLGKGKGGVTGKSREVPQ